MGLDLKTVKSWYSLLDLVCSGGDALGRMTAWYDPCDPKCGIGEWRRTGRCSMSVFVVDIHFRVVDRFLVSVLACLSSASKLVD